MIEIIQSYRIESQEKRGNVDTDYIPNFSHPSHNSIKIQDKESNLKIIRYLDLPWGLIFKVLMLVILSSFFVGFVIWLVWRVSTDVGFRKKYFGTCFKIDSDTAKEVIKDKLKKAKKGMNIDREEVKAIVARVFDENLKKLNDQIGDIIAEGSQQIMRDYNQDEDDKFEDNRRDPFRIIPDRNPYCRFGDTLNLNWRTKYNYFKQFILN